MNKRAYVVIYGDVTGVGYRDWAQKNAKELELTGWVRNVSGGVVEAVVEGKKDMIDTMIARFKNGPVVAWVERVEVEWKEVRGEKDFRILTE